MTYLIIGLVFGFLLLEAMVIWYFFVYKPSLADKEYDRRIREIYNKEWK